MPAVSSAPSTRSAPVISGSAAHVGLTAPFLVGRDRELTLLAEAAANPPAIALVEGEAGVGKSRLVSALLARPELKAHTKLLGNCYETREPFPLGPLVEALSGVHLPAGKRLSPIVGVLSSLLPELEERLPPPPKPLGEPRAERHRWSRAAVELLDSLGPTVLVLEDVHWADAATADFLRVFAPALPSRVSLLVTYRGQELPESSPVLGLAAKVPGSALRLGILLEGLSPDQTGILVGAILGVDVVSDEFAAFIHGRTAGLPFAIEELVRLLRDRRDVVRTGGRWARAVLDELEVPAAVRDTVLERLRRLKADARRVVRAAAVVESSADEEILRAVADLAAPSVAEGLEQAVESGLLREEPDGRVRFRHDLARQAVYEAVPGPTRRAMHLATSRALERVAPKPLGRLAHHYREAGEAEAWMRYAEAAADRAMATGEDVGAARLLREVLEGARRDPSARARLAVKLGQAALNGLDPGVAWSLLRGILDDENLPRSTRGELRLLLGLVLLRAGRSEEGAQEIRRSLADLDERPEVAAEAMSVLSVPWRIDGGNLDEHLDWSDRAMAMASELPDPVVRTRVLVDRAGILLSVGDRRGWAAVRDLPRRSRSLKERRQLARGFRNISQACIHLGHYQEAASKREEGLRLCQEGRDLEDEQGLLTAGLLLDWVRGQWQGLEERARRMAEETVEIPVTWVDAELVRALLLLTRGETGPAEEGLRGVLDAARRSDSMPELAMAAGALARIDLARDRPEAASREALGALEVVAAKGIWVWAAEAAPPALEALVKAGRIGEARGLVARFARGVRGRDAPAARAALAVCRGLLAEAEGRHDLAVRHLARSERLWAELPRPYERARAAERRGALLAAEGRKATGGPALLDALQGFESLGADWDASRVRRTLRAYGLIPPHRRGRKGYGDRLSPRELEVASLVASGHTNREIAERLFLSVKTVGHHVGSAMGKLGLPSRTGFAGHPVLGGTEGAGEGVPSPSADGKS